MENKPIAWLVPNCPNFYYMPSMWYDQIFTEWGDLDSWKCPAYWSSRGFTIMPLVACSNEEATHWIVNNQYGAFSREEAKAAQALGKTVVPVKSL